MALLSPLNVVVADERAPEDPEEYLLDLRRLMTWGVEQPDEEE